MAHSTIKIGSHIISKISYEDVNAGDFLCTYEALTTSPVLLHLESVLKYASFSSRPELNKMFHAEVIVKKYPRFGVFKIAHADGGCKQVVVQDDNFRDHHPGQAFIIFRAKNREIQKEIIKVASRTSEIGNGHICKTFSLFTLPQRVYFCLKSFLFENMTKNASDVTLKKLAVKTINYDKTGRFYGQGESKVMNCVEYVANVVNIATMRVLSKKDCRTDFYQHFTDLNKTENYPLKFSHTDSIPSSFVEFFLKNDSEFQTVGYLGSIQDPIQGSPLDITREKKRTSPSILGKILSDNPYLVRAMKTLKMIDDSWMISPKALKDPAKVKALLTFIHAKDSKQNLSQELLQTLCSAFMQKGEMLQRTQEFPGDILIEFPQIDSLSKEDTDALLHLERDFINSSQLQRTEKTLKLSMNVLSNQMEAINRTKKTIVQLDKISKYFSKNLIFTPFYLFLSSLNNRFQQQALNKEKICVEKIKNILIVHEKNRKKGRIELIEDCFKEGCRPWIHYSKDEGKSWNIEPLIKQDNSWNANIHVSKKHPLIYQFIAGPQDENHHDPLGKSYAQTSLKRVLNKEMSLQKDGYSDVLMIPTCEFPIWKDKNYNFKENKLVIDFQKQCDAVAPDEDWPLSIQEYEANYTLLESRLKACAKPLIQSEDEVIDALIEFVRKELGINILAEQIELKINGLGNGLSGDKLFIISDKNHSPLFVVKAFMKSRGKFSREFISLRNLERLNLKSLNFPKVLGIGTTCTTNQIFFLAMDYIPGMNVYEMFKSFATHKIESSERTKKFEQLLHIYSKLGKMLAEFHLSSKKATGPLHPVLKNLFEMFTKNAFKRFETQLTPNFLERLSMFIETNLPEISKQIFNKGFYHGDLNVGNLIYNPFLDQLTIVDWPDGSFSVGKDGKALGIPFYDIIQVRNELLNMKIEGLSEQESLELYRIFKKSYSEVGLNFPSKKIINFFSVLDLMGSLKWFIDKKETFKADELEMLQKIFQIKKQKLENLIT